MNDGIAGVVFASDSHYFPWENRVFVYFYNSRFYVLLSLPLHELPQRINLWLPTHVHCSNSLSPRMIWNLPRTASHHSAILCLFSMVWMPRASHTTIAHYSIIGKVSCFRLCQNSLPSYLRTLTLSLGEDSLPSHAVISQSHSLYRSALRDLIPIRREDHLSSMLLKMSHTISPFWLLFFILIINIKSIGWLMEYCNFLYSRLLPLHILRIPNNISFLCHQWRNWTNCRLLFGQLSCFRKI